jgi:lysophospholipase L1-like esterase
MALALVALAARGELFNDGETVCFLGDSITHGGRFHRYVSDYYLTRFPTRTVRFVNAGVSGDSAGAGCHLPKISAASAI